MASQLITVIGNELKTGFFVELCNTMNLELDAVCSLWDDYFGAPTFLPSKPSSAPKATAKVQEAKTSEPRKTLKKKGLDRDQQTPVDLSALDKLKVADLRKINKERGISCSGNRALLIELLVEYEQELVGIDEVDESEERAPPPKVKATPKAKTPKTKEEPATITIAPGKKQKKEPAVMKHIQPEELEIDVDDYGHHIVDGDLVLEDESEPHTVIGFIDPDTNDVTPLDKEHIERCKFLNLHFVLGDFDV